MGFNLLALREGGGAGGQKAALDSPQEKEKVAFVSAVPAQTEDAWSRVFKAGGAQYKDSSPVLLETRSLARAAWRARRRGLFTAPRTKKSISTLAFLTS